MIPSIGKVALAVVLVGLGCAGVFVGFEFAAYEETIADREVTTSGEVFDEEVTQLPDGNWTYEFNYRYTFDQETEITDQGLEEVYPDELTPEREYTNVKSGGKHDTRSDARSEMEEEFNENGTVTVYVDPFYPSEGSLSDATSWGPEAFQYGGAFVIAVGLLGLARMARRVSA